MTVARYFLLALLLVGCDRVEQEGPDAQGYHWVKDGPVGTPVIHEREDVFLKCGFEAKAKSCSIIRGGVCDVYLPPNAEKWQEEHERKHCAGWRHPDSLRSGFN